MRGLPDTALVQALIVPFTTTKKNLERKTPKETAEIVADSIDEVNHGSITPLDVLINRRV